jgi:hypothetical protein
LRFCKYLNDHLLEALRVDDARVLHLFVDKIQNALKRIKLQFFVASFALHLDRCIVDPAGSFHDDIVHDSSAEGTLSFGGDWQ